MTWEKFIKHRPFVPFPAVRLVGGTWDSQGRVEVNYNDEWGTVCDDGWNDHDAKVVCRSLGYTHGVAMTDNEYGPGTGTIWLSRVQCNGDEWFLDECRANELGDNDCEHWEDAGVICSWVLPGKGHVIIGLSE